MGGRVLRVAATAMAITVALVMPVIATTTATPASADTVVDGCTIVSNPTPTHFTNCPNANLFGAALSGVDLSYANLSAASLIATDFTGANLSHANLSQATLAQCVDPSGVPPFSCDATFFNGTKLTGANLSHVNTLACGNAAIAATEPPCIDENFVNDDLSGANLSNSDLTGGSFSNANLTGANFTGATFSDTIVWTDTPPIHLVTTTLYASFGGANLTGTLFVPANQNVTATSNAGAMATWTTPASIPGATPGSCSSASGSTFPLFSTRVTCQVFDGLNNVATGTFQVNVTPTTEFFTRMLVPSDGTVVQGSQVLDAAAADAPGIKSVVFEVTGGSLTDQVIATATPTLFGWVAKWNGFGCASLPTSVCVPNGTYSLQSVATDAASNTDTSDPITITVNNPPPPTTAVLIPSGGASLSGATALLDASASSAAGIATVTFEVSGNGLTDQMVATGTPTLYGYLAQWNTTAVPNGTYTLQSVATDRVSETAASAPVAVTVNNAPPSTTVLIPTGGATQSGTAALLDANASPNVTAVTYELTGGTLTNQVIATGTPTIYGYLAEWNTTTVPNGTYILNTVASYAGGVSGLSPPVTVTVSN